jgi:hypothetical protein
MSKEVAVTQIKGYLKDLAKQKTEYDEARKIVKRYDTIEGRIKKLAKAHDIRELIEVIDEDSHTKIVLHFAIGTMSRVCNDMIPADLIEGYTVDSDVWRKTLIMEPIAPRPSTPPRPSEVTNPVDP